jgi:hypothetical protein
MASDPSSLQALKNLSAEKDLILETTPPLPQNRTAAVVLNWTAGLNRERTVLPTW